MKAIIAEKPSVASEFARIVGATDKQEGYFVGGGFMVTWAFGHLVGLAMPEDYGVKGFVRESLPILPKYFQLIGRKVKSGKGFIDDEGSKRQLKSIDHVFNLCDSIIVATDAGREGEVIFRYIYEYLKCAKPFERLWISSLTEKAIVTGLENLKKGSDFDGLFYAGRERSQADWLIGINATQALTFAMGEGLFSLGRVQTPTLALICKRYLENKAFEIKNYFQIELVYLKEGISLKSTSLDKWDDQDRVEAAMRTINRSGAVDIKEIEKKSNTLQAPLLFDLTGLQKEANKKLGYSAERTLEIAQWLYEKKFITYPRTGSKYIPEDVWSEVPALILALKRRDTCKDAVENVKWERYNKHIVNDLKVTDHHGILITENIPSILGPHENALYDMIASRFLESVSPACYREITDITFSVLHYEFTLKAITITSAGWKLVAGDFEEEGENLVTDLPYLEKGTQLKIETSKILAKKTKPPALFTEADLLATMENVGNTMENKDERKALKHIGIRYADLGSDYLIAGKAEDAQNVLRVKAATRDFVEETNFSVITEDGRFYNFNVTYSANPPTLNYDLQKMQKEEDRASEKNVQFEELGFNPPSLTEQVLKTIYHQNKKYIRHIASKAYGIQFVLKGVFVSNGKFYFHTELRNKSNVPFVIDFCTFKIVDKKIVKRTVSQEKLLPPLRQFPEVASIPDHHSMSNVVLLDQFTIADDQLLRIDLYEKNGGRSQVLEIENSDLVNAKPVSEIKLNLDK
ncbi:conjugative transposon protein TraN [Elizabethkingia ursingii]|nr:conjugative transposon protein TraN [Elizabethkingia ursingii]MCL1666553.1 conjugative transposon protein TraN [Elizabethkingia ursingii]